jgi:hypothetical protein
MDIIKNSIEKVKKDNGSRSDISRAPDLDITLRTDPVIPRIPEIISNKGPRSLRYLKARNPRTDMNVKIMNNMPRTRSITNGPMTEKDIIV